MRAAPPVGVARLEQRRFRRLVRLLEAYAVVRRKLEKLPPAQAEVVRLRDAEAMPSDQVCQLLSLTEGNQRVLLHRSDRRSVPRWKST